MLHILFFVSLFSSQGSVATVSLIPRLPISPFDVTNPRFGSGGSPLVGSNGLEPSTSRLSGVRSNHLSYEPISVAVRCAIRPNHLWLRSVPFRDYCLPFRSDCNATWLGASPWWRRTESNCRPPACKAGALPAELRPHIRFVPVGQVHPFEFPWRALKIKQRKTY